MSDQPDTNDLDLDATLSSAAQHLVLKPTAAALGVPLSDEASDVDPGEPPTP